MAWQPPQDVGDRHPKIPDAKRYLGKFSYGRGLGETDEYTVEFGVALRQWQVNIHYQVVFKGRPGPDVNMVGVFDWAVQRQMGIDKPPEPVDKPWIITIAGHLGAMDTGPAYWTALPLEQQGKVQIQMVGYDNWSIPFNNRSGFNELDRIVHHVKPAGVPWAVTAHSQGSLILSDYLEQWVLPNQHLPAYANFRGGVQYGNPRRPMGVVAPWVTDPPDHDSEGLDPDCLDGPLPGVAEVSRKGDLYADKKRTNAGEMKAAVYLAVARARFFGKDTLTEQMGELLFNFGPEVWAVFRAIVDGISFAVNMDPHNVFDLRPGTEHLERILLADNSIAA
ncbi:hypothetical protein [Mycolicibacterium elephantis]|uniref:hypothetical protein n=1 Tax=Mycolicibacterium elephantis TaxID=81858 RepID=UPI0007EA559C|nr:hypothetical protein [Mycolicibacterium elephantis]OBB20624.1 hypothetical protein A5762_15325 [Mycolicibacterium elephantis]